MLYGVSVHVHVHTYMYMYKEEMRVGGKEGERGGGRERNSLVGVPE